MPLDDTTGFLAAPAETIPDLSRPSLRALAYVLRHREEWPIINGARWEWCFGIAANECGTAGCAIGIMDSIWHPARDGKLNQASSLAGMFCARAQAMYSIFITGSTNRRVSPEVVAGRIDDYLAGRPVRYLVEGDRS